MSTVLRADRCLCGADMLSGDCDYGIAVHADTGPLSIVGEAMAVLMGRRTFDLIRLRGWRLMSRTDAVITARLSTVFAKPETVSVLAEHVCGVPLPTAAHLPSALVTVTPPARKLPHDDAMADALGMPRLFPLDPPF